MKAWIFALLMLASGSLSGQTSWSGKYALHLMYDQERLDLKPDSTFWLGASSCTWRFEARGTWQVSGDTLLLSYTEVKDHYDGWTEPDHNGDGMDQIRSAYDKGYRDGAQLHLKRSLCGHHPEKRPGMSRLAEPVDRGWRR
jgi:hypothetical protein